MASEKSDAFFKEAVIINNSEILKEILELPEIGSFGKIVEKWSLLEERMTSGIVNVDNILPEVFLYAKPGIGKSNLMYKTASYLEKTKIMEFCGDKNYFEYHFEYCEPGSTFNEIRRFKDNLQVAAGARNKYKGVICIELDEWEEHYTEKYFGVFMEFLQDLSNDSLYIFTIDRESEEVNNMIAYMTMFFRLEVAAMNLPTKDSFLNNILVKLSRYGFEIDEKGKKILNDTLEELMSNKYFYGYKTIERLTKDIIYEIYTKNDYKDRKIGENDLNYFKRDSEYVERLKDINKINSFGFRCEETKL